MQKSALKITLLSILSTLIACNYTKTNTDSVEGDTVRMKYAENISIVRYKNYTKVELANPWKKVSALHTYILVDKGSNKSHLPDGTIVNIPLSNSAVSSGIYGSLIDELGAVNRIKAVCDIKYFTNKNILKAYNKGKVINLGNSMAPNIEVLINLNPDAILMSPFENSGGYGQIETLNIPIIECADYMETSPLGRAEWMLFYGMLYGKTNEAKKLFTKIEKEYNGLKKFATTHTTHPKVICDVITGSTWYVPGGNSTTGKLIADAGGDYVFRNRHESGSLALAPETVFDKSQNADVWFIKYTQPTDKTYNDLVKDSPLYSQIKAFKDKSIYGCNLSYVPFFNDLPFHPERNIKELIKMFEPNALPDYNLNYYKKLERK